MSQITRQDIPGPEFQGNIGTIGEIALFGARGGHSWRRESDPGASDVIGPFLRQRGVSRVYAPDTRFNGVIHNTITSTRRIEASVELVTLEGSEGVTDLQCGEAVWLASADCPTVVLTDGHQLAVVHAGRWSLIDPWWQNGNQPDERPSVIENAVGFFPENNRELIKASIHCGIGPHSFNHPLDHPKFGTSNRRLLLEVWRRWPGADKKIGQNFHLSLVEIIRRQFEDLDVRTVLWDEIDTFSERDPHSNELLWWSAARGDSNRNGVIVWRSS